MSPSFPEGKQDTIAAACAEPYFPQGKVILKRMILKLRADTFLISCHEFIMILNLQVCCLNPHVTFAKQIDRDCEQGLGLQVSSKFLFHPPFLKLRNVPRPSWGGAECTASPSVSP